jgi:hypothetical protein
MLKNRLSITCARRQPFRNVHNQECPSLISLIRVFYKVVYYIFAMSRKGYWETDDEDYPEKIPAGGE